MLDFFTYICSFKIHFAYTTRFKFILIFILIGLRSTNCEEGNTCKMHAAWKTQLKTLKWKMWKCHIIHISNVVKYLIYLPIWYIWCLMLCRDTGYADTGYLIWDMGYFSQMYRIAHFSSTSKSLICAIARLIWNMNIAYESMGQNHRW